jgi:ribulose-phosphate 3-epimerase
MYFKLAPSILAADFANLGQQIQDAEAAGADWFHLDVMDGHFVPNITFGPMVVKAIRPLTNLPLDVHLMIDKPDQYLADFVNAGADRITVHVEACVHLHRTLQQIQELGLKTGVALNPATPLTVLEEVLPMVDLVLLMSVNPGFGGQQYISHTTPKINRLRRMLDHLGKTTELQVDGGLNPNTIAQVVQAGATIVVAGSAVFGGGASVAENIARLREAAG